MDIEIQLIDSPIAETISPPSGPGVAGVWIEFRGTVRGEENGKALSALEYEAYPEMAEREIRRLLTEISAKRPCLAARVIHRLGAIPVGETAVYVGVAAKHRGEAIALLAEFMDRLKQDVPIWKRRAIAAAVCDRRSLQKPAQAGAHRAPLQLDEAISEIQSRCQPLPPVRVSLNDAVGRVLRATVCAPEDLPDCDRSTRDGFAILKDDASGHFQIVDTLHAADWKPRELKTGQAVRVATGAPLPGENLRVVMQENVERNGDQIKILKPESAPNLRRRGEDVKAGAPLVKAGGRLDAGKLALLATAGCAQPLVSPRLRVCHFATGDEIIPPRQTPRPGQVRDSNSILIRGLLQGIPCDVEQGHLPENFEVAKSQIGHRPSAIGNADVLLVSGGASVGDKDFTRALLVWLGYEIIFSQVNVRPGRPLIFGLKGTKVAFGLPGNPLSHFVCFHFAVATALARLAGQEGPVFLRGRLAAQLADEPCPRETLWPARLERDGEALRLHPLKWSSSGDVTCLAETQALIRVPVNQGSIAADEAVDFLAATDMLGGS
jgi:molybdopterin molybdotransferase